MKRILLFTLFFTTCVQAQNQEAQLVIIPEQQSWIAGTDFTARAVLVDAPMKEAEFFFSTVPLPKDSEGAGILKFKVSAGAYDARGQARKTVEITARYKQKGKTIILKASHTYLIKRPNLVYKVPVEDILYVNCGNELFVTCTDLGTQYNPTFQASGSLLIKGSLKGQLTAVPTYGEVILNVSSGGTALDSKKFKALAPPLPKLSLLLDSIPCDSMQAVSSKSKLYLRIKPDPDFLAKYPKDARYSLTQGILKVTRHGVLMESIPFTEQTIDFTELGISLQKKDVLYIEVAAVNRKNFLNREIPEKELTQTFVLTIQ